MSSNRYSGRFPMMIGFFALALLVCGVGVWSVRTEIAGAIIANGTIVLENNRQVVQHAEGGIVKTISARDGTTVQSGDILVSLDDRTILSELAIVELRLIEIRARGARLEAERDELDEIDFPTDLLSLVSQAAMQQMHGQRILLRARRETAVEEHNQLGERRRQTENQIEGAKAQLAALIEQETIAGEELAIQTEALEAGLTQAARVSALKREALGLRGDIGRLNAEIARLNSEIASVQIEAVRLRNARREMAITELRDIQFQELELEEQTALLTDRLARLDIRAPVSGVVFGSSIFAEQAVIRPAEPLMFVVPYDEPLIVNARVDSIHIDQVRLGQAATLRFSAFNQRITPEVGGFVVDISADILADEITGQQFYSVELMPQNEALPELGDQTLVPGMPVEVLLRTDDRTPLSYLTKPFTDYFGRAFRES